MPNGEPKRSPQQKSEARSIEKPESLSRDLDPLTWELLS